MSRRGPPPAVPRTPGGSEKKYVKATWEYKANEPGELSFSVGDLITVVTEDPSGWWIGEINGVKGQFPLNFTEPCAPPPEKVAPPIAPKPSKLVPITAPVQETPKPAPSPIAPSGGGGGDPMSELRAKLANRSTIAPGELSPIKKEANPSTTSTPKKAAEAPASGPTRSLASKDNRGVSMIANKPPVAPRPSAGSNANTTPVALPNLSPVSAVPNVSQLKPVRPMQKSADSNSNSAPNPAAVPLRKSENTPIHNNIANELKMRSPSSNPSLSQSAQLPAPSPIVSSGELSESGEVEPAVEKGLVTFDYTATGDTEITLVKGDTIVILEKNDSGWWNGQLSDGSKGWFPSDFVELIAEDEPSIGERLAEVGSKEPRLATPKRAMGKAGRRPPTRGKKAGAAVKSVKTETKDAPADLKGRTTVIGMAPIKLDEALKLKPTPKSPLSGRANNNAEEPLPSPVGPGGLKPTRAPAINHNNNNNSADKEEGPSRLVALKKRGDESPVEKPATPVEKEEPARVITLKKRSEPSPVAEEKPVTPVEKEEPVRAIALKKRNDPSPAAEEKPATPVEKEEPVRAVALKKRNDPSPVVEKEEKPVESKPIVVRSSKPDLKSPQKSPRESPRESPQVDPSANSTPLPGNLGEFAQFQSAISEIFNQCKNKNISGELHSNPILQKSNPSSFAFAFESVAGHKFSLGDSSVPFCLHDAINPLIYAIGHSEIGKDKVAALVGESKNVNENSGFDGKKAANLTTDAASLLISSNLFTNEEGPLRCYQFQQILSSLVGPRGVGFDMPTYLSAQYSNDSLFASAYLMSSQNVLGKKKSVKESIDLILQLRSISLNCESAASLAASLANSQNSPIASNSLNAMLNSVKKFGPASVPAITSISGAIIVILPNIGGISIYSPLLNNNLVGAKSLELCNSFLSKFNLA